MDDRDSLSLYIRRIFFVISIACIAFVVFTGSSMTTTLHTTPLALFLCPALMLCKWTVDPADS